MSLKHSLENSFAVELNVQKHSIRPPDTSVCVNWARQDAHVLKE